jgi:asparagine synthase (glutamine-hydrolysing)
MAIYLLAREAAREVRVLLTGDGADEIFAGYVRRFTAADELWDGWRPRPLSRLAERARSHTQWVRWENPAVGTKAAAVLRALVRAGQRGRDDAFNLMRLIFSDAEKHALYTADWRARTRPFSTLQWLNATLSGSTTDRLTRWQLHDVATSLHDEMLAKVDKATMAWGVEARVPYLDHRLVELALNVPRRLKIRDGRGKWILQRLGGRYLPPEILNRPKQGFSIPLSVWFRTDLRALVRDVLSPSAIRRAGIFQPAAVDRVLAHHDANPRFVSAHMLFTLVCFQMWYERAATTR